MIGACQNMLLFGVSTISVALLTYLLVLPLLFRCDGLTQGISGWLNGKAAAASRSSSSSIRDSIEDGSYNVGAGGRSLLASLFYSISWVQAWYLPKLWLTSSSFLYALKS